MDLRLRGKAALITGSSRGLGRAIAIELAREGCHIGLCARGAEPLEAAASDIRALGAQVTAVAADVTTAEGMRQVVDVTLRTFGGIDVRVKTGGATVGTSCQRSTEAARDAQTDTQ